MTYQPHYMDTFCDDNLRFSDLYCFVIYKEWDEEGENYKAVKTSCDISVEEGSSREAIEEAVSSELNVLVDDIIEINYK